jgi:3-oxoacyl-[acyl-carrier-protein] synthase II
MLKRRVVVTGLGMVSPLGTGVEKTWNALIQGKSGVGRITKFDSTGFDTQIAAEVKDFTPENFIEKKEIRRMDIFIQYAIAGAQMAMDDSQLKITPENAERVGVVVGAGLGGLTTLEMYHKILLERTQPDFPLFHSHDNRERSSGAYLHAVRGQRPQHLRGHRLRYGKP